MEISPQEIPILREIQRDAALSLAELSSRTGIAQSTLWRKLNEMEAAGVIRARVALLDPAKVGAKLCVLAQISLMDHSEACVTGFTQLVRRLPEVLECHSVSGQADYMLKVRCRDVEAYEAFMSHHLLRSGFVRAVQSSFVLKEIKATTALPLG
ncbi:Lrp/AsnC family transcriptional regulator [Frigidibacter sp. RF13]|uniref:Lrp/AsnC family transcriptional regulator n=1 Tax=Frigidibacter sp. RF13 TaxID=2997340 RepID=UPI0022704695|nr:Lrp/AsnC family transcriptional regulator [Frigidibacter sp. RF13]MCY1127985.1 Lrp/AsnC family transcriptional regulator [Frigidibacter sp. RF13]